MKRAVAVLALLLPVAGQNASRPPLTEPGISPDGKEIAFVSGGDIWTVATSGGEARLLVAHAATESRPLFSPDGTKLAFTSTRTGSGDIYTLDLPTQNLRRLTYTDALERVDGWSPDSSYVYFSTSLTDVAGMQDVLRVSAAGGTPMVWSGDRYANEYFAAPGKTALALTTKGIMTNQWWRKGHSHIDETEIWVERKSDKSQYERVTAGGAKEGWPMWSEDEKRLYFTSDRSGAENIWEKAIGSGAPRQITEFKDGRLLWPSSTPGAKTIVFERDFEIWRLDTGSKTVAKVPIELRGVPSGPSVEHLTLTSQFSGLALSPDNKKVAFIARGDLFAAASKEAGSATRITSTPALEAQPVWADNNRITFVSYKNGSGQIFSYDLGANTETQVTNTQEGDQLPRWSPDGKQLAFIRGGAHLVIHDPATKQERVVATTKFGKPPATDDTPFAWSADSKWLAYAEVGDKSFRNISVVPAAGGTAIPVSFLPNVYGDGIAWGRDGKYLLFGTAQRTETSRVARIDLVPRTPKFREDQFRDLFTRPKNVPEPAKPDPAVTTAEVPVKPPPTTGTPPPKIVAEGIRRRASFLPLDMDVSDLVISPDGKSLLLTATGAGQQNLYLYSLDELEREPIVPKQLTSTAGSKNNAQFTSDNKEVFYLENGRIQTINVDNRQARPIAISAEVDVDFATTKRVVFGQAWDYLNDWFYDPAFHGLDWNGAKSRYAPFVEGSRTPDEMRRVISLMIGELNASHLGISPPPAGGASSGGRLGLSFDRKEYEATGLLRVSEVIPLSPADVAEIKPGTYLLAVDSVTLDKTKNLDSLLTYKVARKVTLSVADDASGLRKRDIEIQPCTLATEKNLLYRAWVESRRDYISKASGGRLGYVHMADMSASSLESLYLDLDVENHRRDGVVVDIRNNSGGFVNAYALDVLTRRPYLNMTTRGSDPAPARSVLGQRALEKPTILVVNQHSLSDAEDFTEGYRAMKLGKVVGQPTAGWIIYTGGVGLIDGSVLRLPRIKVTTVNGENMERNPRPVDIAVDRPYGETFTGKDSQLDAAVKHLIGQIDSSASK